MEKLIEKIQKANKIGIFTHKNADPDALGSVSAFFHAMKTLKKSCTIFLNESFDSSFDFLKLENVFYETEKHKFEDFDLFVSLDAASSERLGLFGEYFKKHKNTIEIDHHKNRKGFASISIVKPYSSNVEILFDLFKNMKIKISPFLATCLYTGLVADTDGFKNASTTALSHKNAYELIKLGAEIEVVNKAVFYSKEFLDLLFMKKVIERVEFDNHIALSHILQKDLKEFGKGKLIAGDLVNLLMTLKNVEISVLIKQEKGKNFTISLRSSKNYNVGTFCAKYGGGGHNQAAGMTLVGSLKQVKDILLKGLKKLESTN